MIPVMSRCEVTMKSISMVGQWDVPGHLLPLIHLTITLTAYNMGVYIYIHTTCMYHISVYVTHTHTDTHTQYASTLVYTSFLSEKKTWSSHSRAEQLLRHMFWRTDDKLICTIAGTRDSSCGRKPFPGHQDSNWFNLITEESQVNCDQSSYVSSYFQTPMEGSAYTPRSCKSSLD